jgi:heme exporter protein D
VSTVLLYGVVCWVAVAIALTAVWLLYVARIRSIRRKRLVVEDVLGAERLPR